jgi:5,10-methylenetetrahydromethanopterin reductase
MTEKPLLPAHTSPPEIGLRFGVAIGPRPERLLERLDEWTEVAEQGQVDLLSTGEAPHLFHDPFMLLNMVAERSTRALVGPIVTTPHFRHPAVLATTAATLQEVSHGRAFLGLGTGDPGFLAGIGATPTPFDAFLKYAGAVKALSAGEAIVWDGVELRPNVDTRRVPILFGAEGRRMLQAAGEHADGAIIGNGATPDKVRFSLEHIAAGAAAAGRSMDELDVWFMVRMHVAESEEQGADELAFYAARWVPHALSSARAMEARGVQLDPDLAERIARYLGEYSLEQAYVTGSRYNVDLLEKYGIKHWATRQFLLTGSVNEIVARVQGLIDAGARNMIVAQLLPDYLRNTLQAGQVFAAIRRAQADRVDESLTLAGRQSRSETGPGSQKISEPAR